MRASRVNQKFCTDDPFKVKTTTEMPVMNKSYPVHATEGPYKLALPLAPKDFVCHCAASLPTQSKSKSEEQLRKKLKAMPCDELKKYYNGILPRYLGYLGSYEQKEISVPLVVLAWLCGYVLWDLCKNCNEK